MSKLYSITGLPETCPHPVSFSVPTQLDLRLGFGLGLVLVFVCDITTATGLSYIEYKKGCGALFR